MVRALDVARWSPWLRDQRYAQVSPSSEALPVTFPTARLSCKVLIALGADLTQPWYTWSWTDVSQWVRFDSGISTSQGRPDWTSTSRASSGQLVFDNRDGRFSRRNPTGPYYGLLTFNTPIWGTVDPGSGVVSRLQQFVNEWPTRWDITGKDSTVPIQTAGVMRRLAQNGSAKSALRRCITAAQPIAYWPLEDGSSSTTASSGLSGGDSLRPSGAVTFAGATAPAGSAAAPDLTNSGRLTGPLPANASTGWTLEFVANCALAPLDIPVEVDVTGGTYVSWWIYTQIDGSLGVQMNARTASGLTVATLSAAAIANYDGQWHHYRLTVTQSGPDIAVALYLDGVGTTNTFSSATVGTLSRIVVNSALAANNSISGSVAHVAVYDGVMAVDHSSALSGYAGEMAHSRIARVAAEERVALASVGAISPVMGPQPIAPALDILHDAEAVDGGVLYETAWGLGYQSLAERTNEPVSLALDFDRRHVAVPPEPADDDQRLHNRWTANRTSGSSSVAERFAGSMGITTAGLYEDSVTPNVQTDTQLLDQAGWRLHLSTVDEDRWPSIAIRLHATPDLIPSWVAMPFGGRVTAANPPSQVAPDTIDAVLEGWSERWDPYTWVADLNTSPFSPYLTGVLAADTGDTDSHLLILTPDTLTLAADVSTSDVTWSINSSPLWTVDPESFPRYIWWEGEIVQLTNCVGAAAPQTWTVVRSINGVVKAHLANSSGHIYRPGALALA